MLDFFGIIALTLCVVVAFTAFVSAMQIGLRAKVMLAVVVGLWIGLAIALGAINEYADVGRRLVPLIGIMWAAPLIVVALIAAFSAAARRAMLSVSMPVLIGTHVLRLIGGSFLLLAAAGRLDGPFPVSAGWGDIAAAVLAIPAAMIAAGRGGVFLQTGRAPTDADWNEGDRLIGFWNWFGALDLFVAVALATVSTPGSQFQLIPTSVGPAAMQFLPWVLIPTVLVPYLLISHGIVYAQLHARARKV